MILLVYLLVFVKLVRQDGLLVLGQDQDSVGGGYDRSVSIVCQCFALGFVSYVGVEMSKSCF